MTSLTGTFVVVLSIRFGSGPNLVISTAVSNLEHNANPELNCLKYALRKCYARFSAFCMLYIHMVTSDSEKMCYSLLQFDDLLQVILLHFRQFFFNSVHKGL